MREGKSMMENMTEVFGGSGPSFSWILPTAVWFPDRELAFGYITHEEEEPLAMRDAGDAV